MPVGFSSFRCTYARVRHCPPSTQVEHPTVPANHEAHSPRACTTLPLSHLVLFSFLRPFPPSAPLASPLPKPSIFPSSGPLLRPARALLHNLLIREWGCSGVICIKLECPLPLLFGGVRGLDDPLMRDEDGEAAKGVPIGLCTRRHDTEGESPTWPSAEPEAPCGGACRADRRARSASRGVLALWVAQRARLSEPGKGACLVVCGTGGKGGRGGRGGRGGAMDRCCCRMGCAGS